MRYFALTAFFVLAACTVPGTAKKVTTLVNGRAVKFSTQKAAVTPEKAWTPHALAYSDNGNVWASDSKNHRIISISPTGIVAVFAGGSASGSTNGELDKARFDTPRGLSWDGTWLWVADTGNQSIRQINPQTGVVKTPRIPARLQSPVALLSVPEQDALWIAEASGEILLWRPSVPRELNNVANLGEHRVIRKLMLAPNGQLQFLDNTGLWTLNAERNVIRGISQVDQPRWGGFTYQKGNLLLTAPFGEHKLLNQNLQPLVTSDIEPALHYPGAMASNATGTVIADVGNQTIYKLDTLEDRSLSVSLLARSGTQGFGERSDNEDLSLPHGLLYLPEQKKLWVGDYYHNRILEIDAEGRAFPLFENSKPRLSFPTGMVKHPNGNIYISSSGSHQIFVYKDNVLSVFAGSGQRGLADGASQDASFWLPWGLTLDPQGNLYVADHGNHAIRKITPSGEVSTLAGNGRPGFVNGQGEHARFHHPVDVLYYQKKLLISDSWNHQLRFLNLNNQKVSTYAGRNSPGLQDGSRNKARFYSPSGLSEGPKGGVYIADTWNHRIRQMNSRGEVTTLAGDGRYYNWNSGDEDTPFPRFQQPRDVFYDKTQHVVYVADTANHNVRVIEP